MPSILLQPFTPADIPRLLGWIDSADALFQWAGPSFTYPLDEAQLRAHLARAAGPETTSLIYKVVSAEAGASPESREVVGHVELVNIDRVICVPANRNQPDREPFGLGATRQA